VNPRYYARVYREALTLCYFASNIKTYPPRINSPTIIDITITRSLRGVAIVVAGGGLRRNFSESLVEEKVTIRFAFRNSSISCLRTFVSMIPTALASRSEDRTIFIFFRNTSNPPILTKCALITAVIPGHMVPLSSLPVIITPLSKTSKMSSTSKALVVVILRIYHVEIGKSMIAKSFYPPNFYVFKLCLEVPSISVDTYRNTSDIIQTRKTLSKL